MNSNLMMISLYYVKENDLDKCYFNEILKVGHKYRHTMKRLGIKTEQDKLITATVQGIVHEDK